MKILLFVSICLLQQHANSAFQECQVSPTSECDCQVDASGLRTINCRYKSLTSIPVFNQTNIIYDKIDFSSTEPSGTCLQDGKCNNITSILANAFANLRVKQIDLRRNAITSYDVAAFEGLQTDLEELYIEGDGIVSPSYISMIRLQSLKKLHLENYGQASISVSNSNIDFPDMLSLTLEKFPNLNLIEAQLFGALPELQEFTIKEAQQMTVFPVQAILNLQKLQKLTYAGTKIDRIYSQSFLTLDHLIDVSIEKNDNLRTIDVAAFEGVTDTIQYLNLRQNKLTSDNLSFLNYSEWTQLNNLDMGYNSISTLRGGQFAKMPNLEYLTIQDAALTRIESPMLQGLSSLHTLDLAYNMIENIGARAFSSCPTLTELRLHDQQLGNQNIVFAADAFGGIESSLQHLILNKNNFNKAQFWNDLKVLTQLLELNLDDTQLSVIPDEVFSANTKLQYLYLANNNINTVKQESLVGPRETLLWVDLSGNNITTVNECILSDFPAGRKPQLILRINPLRCDCDLLWLYDWVNNQTNPSDAAIKYVAPCASPPTLANQYLDSIQRSDMCSSPPPEPSCPDLYATTTTTTTTQAPRPFPTFELFTSGETTNSVLLTWTVSDRTDVTAYKIIKIPTDGLRETRTVHKDESQYTFPGLKAGSYYTFCLVLEVNNVVRDDKDSCKSMRTLSDITDKPTDKPSSTTAAPEKSTDIGIIVGGAVGALVLVAILVAIFYILCRSSKPKKRAPMTEGMRFTSRADVPHAGGTAKRFGKKPEKEGASPEDISVTIISGSDMSKDRLSAGSYQYLNEKDPRRVNGNPMPVTNGHYTNNIEERPLPKAPGGATKHGYENTAFKGSADPLPETSTNQYSEVRY